VRLRLALPASGSYMDYRARQHADVNKLGTRDIPLTGYSAVPATDTTKTRRRFTASAGTNY